MNMILHIGQFSYQKELNYIFLKKKGPSWAFKANLHFLFHYQYQVDGTLGAKLRKLTSSSRQQLPFLANEIP